MPWHIYTGGVADYVFLLLLLFAFVMCWDIWNGKVRGIFGVDMDTDFMAAGYMWPFLVLGFLYLYWGWLVVYMVLDS